MKKNNFSKKLYQRGTSLIEILVAVLILAAGMLGIAAGQLASLKNNSGSLRQSQATIQIYSMLDAMRANAPAARLGQYNRTMGEGACEIPGGTSLITRDVNRFLTNLQRNLGEGACASINCNRNDCVVVVRWNDERRDGGDEFQELSVTTQI